MGILHTAKVYTKDNHHIPFLIRQMKKSTITLGFETCYLEVKTGKEIAYHIRF